MAAANFEQVFDRASKLANHTMLTVAQAPEHEQELLGLLERALMRGLRNSQKSICRSNVFPTWIRSSGTFPSRTAATPGFCAFSSKRRTLRRINRINERAEREFSARRLKTPKSALSQKAVIAP